MSDKPRQTRTNRWCLLVLLVCGSVHGVQAQTPSGPFLIRMAAGEGARLFAGGGQQGTEIRLGMTTPAGPAIPGLELLPVGGRLQSICCTEARGLQCLTERSVTLEAREKDVLSRYGPPKQSSGGTLVYSGIRFRLGSRAKQAQVEQICVVPR